jgi:hypothetical protein
MLQAGRQPSKKAIRAAEGVKSGNIVAKAVLENAPIPTTVSMVANSPSNVYMPKQGTANYAFLICMIKAEFQGKRQWGKDELMDATQASGLATKPLRNANAVAEATKGNYHKTYDGWSCLMARFFTFIQLFFLELRQGVHQLQCAQWSAELLLLAEILSPIHLWCRW